MDYVVMLGDRPVGRMSVSCEGMFYKMECYCQLKCEQQYDLILKTKDQRIRLGRCVPYKNGIKTVKRIAKRQLQGAIVSVCLEENIKCSLITVEKTEVFPTLSQLKQGRLIFDSQSGQWKIRINGV